MSVDIYQDPAQLYATRPSFFEDPALDRLYRMFLNLAEEVAVQTEKNDTLERVLIEKGLLQTGDVAAYQPDQAVQQQRISTHQDFSARLLKVLTDEVSTYQAKK